MSKQKQDEEDAALEARMVIREDDPDENFLVLQHDEDDEDDAWLNPRPPTKSRYDISNEPEDLEEETKIAEVEPSSQTQD